MGFSLSGFNDDLNVLYEEVAKEQYDELVKKIFEVILGWSHNTLSEIIDYTPMQDTKENQRANGATGDITGGGTLRRSNQVEISYTKTNISSYAFTARMDDYELNGQIEIDYKKFIKTGELYITFSANTIYAHYIHEGIHPKTGRPLQYSLDGTGSHFITKILERELPKLDLLLKAI